MRGRRGVVIGTVAALLSACTGSVGSTSRLNSPEALLAWLLAHRGNVGLAVLPDGAPEPTVELNSRSLFPLASTKKVLILTAYAMAVSSHRLTEDELVGISALDHYYWAGTDGGAHVAALQDWEQRHVVSDRHEVTLAAVAEAMIRWSDNAAADYLLARVGGPTVVAATAAHLGMTAQQPLAPILGELRCWTDKPDQWLSSSPEQRVGLAEAALGSGATMRLPGVAEQRRLAETDPAGTPEEWARAMRQLATEDRLPASASAIIRRDLNWPLTAFPENRDAYAMYMTKGGSLPGVITEVSYIRSQGAAAGVTVALFLHDLPVGVEQTLRANFQQQHLIRALATDARFRDEAARQKDAR